MSSSVGDWTNAAVMSNNPMYLVSYGFLLAANAKCTHKQPQTLKTCALHKLQSHFYGNPKKHCSKTSNGTEIIAVSRLLCRLKTLWFYLPWIGNTPTPTSSKHSRSQDPSYNRSPRGKANTQRFCVLVGQVPLCSCAVELALRDGSALYFHHLRVRACTDRLLSPCHHPSVSSFRPRNCMVGRTMAPSQLQAAPTPRRCGRSKDKWTKPMIFVDFAFWHDLKVIFTVSKRPASVSQTLKVTALDYGRTIHRAIKSERQCGEVSDKSARTR